VLAKHIARADTRLHATPWPVAEVVLRVDAADMVQGSLCTALSHVTGHQTSASENMCRRCALGVVDVVLCEWRLCAFRRLPEEVPACEG
jgi:hypothetical protein